MINKIYNKDLLEQIILVYIKLRIYLPNKNPESHFWIFSLLRQKSTFFLNLQP